MRPRIRRASIAITAGMLLGSGAARAVGDDALHTGAMIDATTQVCRVRIASAGASYANRAAASMIACLDAIVTCYEQDDAAKALACRQALLVPSVGKCAVGKLDDGIVVSGDGCSATCTIQVPPPPGPSSAVPATGQATRWNTSGIIISCMGTGQDGEIQAGAAHAYVDNGDGTITDTNTGLMWEKLSDDGTIHDWNNSYAWDDAFATKVATLNGRGGFAGHSDWRMPNIKELQSIVNYELLHPGPMVTAPSNAGCPVPCTVPPCSCAQANTYWPSSSSAYFPYFAWAVYFYDGNGYAYYKTYFYYVRAVRGGS